MFLSSSISRRVAVSLPFLFALSWLTACSQESSYIDEQRLVRPSPEIIEERARAEQALMADELGWSFTPYEGGRHPIEIHLPAQQYSDPQVLVALEGQITSEWEIVQVRWMQMDGPEGVFLNVYQRETSVWIPAVERRQELRLRLVAVDAAGHVNYADTRIVVAPQEAEQSLAGAEVTIQEEQFLITVNLAEPAQQTVNLDYLTQDGSARAGEDYEHSEGVLLFSPGEQTQTVTVPLLQSWQADGRFFYLNLSGEIGGERFNRVWVLPLPADPPLASKPEALEPVFEGESDLSQLELMGARGALRAYLQWPESSEVSAMLQMRVTDACGNELSLAQPHVLCDAAVGQYEVVSQATHNLVWPDTALSGEYQIVLEHISGPGTEYTVRMFWGDESAVYSGYLGVGEQVPLAPIAFEGYLPWAEKVLPIPSQPNSNVAAGLAHSLVVDVDQVLWAWGDDAYGALNRPESALRAVAVAAGAHHSLALAQSGQVWVWGDNAYGQVEVPDDLSQVVAIAAGVQHSIALQNNGQIIAWGNNGYGQTDVPGALRAKAIAAGDYFNLALRENGSLVAWGDNSSAQTNIPEQLPPISAIAAGGAHSLALLTHNGSVVAWGENQDGQSTVPEELTQVVAIAAGQRHSLALRADGTVIAWGADNEGQSTVPDGLREVVAIAAGGAHSLALTADGKVVVWGSDELGQGSVPSSLLEERRISLTKHMRLLTFRGAEVEDITHYSSAIHSRAFDSPIEFPAFVADKQGYALAFATSIYVSISDTTEFLMEGKLNPLYPSVSDTPGSEGLRLYLGGGQVDQGQQISGEFIKNPGTPTLENILTGSFLIAGGELIGVASSPTNPGRSSSVSLKIPDYVLPGDLLLVITRHWQRVESETNMGLFSGSRFSLYSDVTSEWMLDVGNFVQVVSVWSRTATIDDIGQEVIFYNY